ncbi:hypothetical protein L1887_35666 [Cichorium endivia]|nr:hypothetical protein L1887_35666 [Cichorium endivia]
MNANTCTFPHNHNYLVPNSCKSPLSSCSVPPSSTAPGPCVRAIEIRTTARLTIDRTQFVLSCINCILAQSNFPSIHESNQTEILTISGVRFAYNPTTEIYCVYRRSEETARKTVDKSVKLAFIIDTITAVINWVETSKFAMSVVGLISGMKFVIVAARQVRVIKVTKNIIKPIIAILLLDQEKMNSGTFFQSSIFRKDKQPLSMKTKSLGRITMVVAVKASRFDNITMAPPDPILGVSEAFKADTNDA